MGDAELLGTRRAMILVGMHFGAIEMPGMLAVQGVGALVTPMEFVAHPLTGDNKHAVALFMQQFPD